MTRYAEDIFTHEEDAIIRLHFLPECFSYRFDVSEPVAIRKSSADHM